MFQGAAALSLDAKGRLTVPSRHRDALLDKSSPPRLVLTAHPDGCLLLYPAGAWEPIRARVMGFPALDARFSVWKRLLVGFAEEVEIDAAWRVLISPELRQFASLEKPVMLGKNNWSNCGRRTNCRQGWKILFCDHFWG
jgi:MraZ protein